MAQARTRMLWLIPVGLVLAGAWWAWSSGQVTAPGDATSAGEPVAEPVVPRGGPELVIDPSLGQRAAISGTVRGPDGQPVAGASVCAQTDARSLDAALIFAPVCAQTGRDGHYRLDGLWAVRYSVSAGAPTFVAAFYTGGKPVSYEPIDLRAGAEASGVDIVLVGGGVEIAGVVKDLSGGPVEGAIVTAGGLFEGTGITHTRSGLDGEFTLWVRPGGASVRARAEGYAGGSDSGAAPGHRYEVFLTPESVLVGKVVRKGDGTPVEGARVTAARGDTWFGGDGGAVTDAGGNFRLAQLTPGAYKPSAEGDDSYGMAAEQVILGLGETSAPVVIEAHPAATVEGKVVVAGGRSCERGSVTLRQAAVERHSGGEIEADGVVRIRGVLAGTYEVSVYCEGSVPAESYESVTVADQAITGLRWEVTPGRSIRGTVVTARGEPAPGLWVNARGKADRGAAPVRTGGSSAFDSDSQGRFELRGLLPGTYELRVLARSQPRATPDKPVEVTLPEGQDLEDIRIELPASGEVRGEVRDAQGGPVARARVSLQGSGRRGGTVTTADDGTFHLAEVAAGEYRVTAQRDNVKLRAPGTGDDDLQGQKVEVRADEVATVQLVVETGHGKIGGLVREAGGGPVTDAFVEATRESESAVGQGSRERWFAINQRPHLTDAEGRFALDELAPGRYTVRALRRGGGEATIEHVSLGATVELTIAETGRLAGAVALAGGGAPQEFSVLLEDPSVGYRRTDQFFRTGGAWSFAELPPGKYRLQVSAAEGTQTVEVSLGTGEEKAGVRIELAAKVTLRGTVVDLEGKPVPHIAVQVSETGSFRFGASGSDGVRTDAQGKFEIAAAPTGTVRILAAAPRGGAAEYSQAMITTTISGGPVVELPPIRLVEKKVKTGEAAGDLGYALQLPRPGADPTQRKLVVALARPGGPAAAAGLQAGDEIVSVNGEDVTGERRYLYEQLVQVPVGEVVRLGLARGATVEVAAGAPP